MTDREELLSAVNFLATSPTAPHHYTALNAVIKIAHLPVKFFGDLEVVNPLLDLYREDRDAFQRVLELVDKKRAGFQLIALREAPTDFDRNEYQREFMLQKRARERRSAEIENKSRPERDKLIGQPRIEFMRQAGSKWKRRRDAALKAARERNGGTLTKDEMLALLSRFWEQIDTELDAAEAEADKKIRGW